MPGFFEKIGLYKRFLMNTPRWLLTIAIRGYQKTLSPDHGPLRHAFPNGYCRFYPSCSAYAVDALATHHLFRALGLIFWRLLRCHPWSKGGYDPIH
jgi:putative membrane protein insertion efficiency factor